LKFHIYHKNMDIPIFLVARFSGRVCWNVALCIPESAQSGLFDFPGESVLRCFDNFSVLEYAR